MLEHVVNAVYGGQIGVGGDAVNGFYIRTLDAAGGKDSWLEGLTEDDVRMLQRALMVLMAESRVQARSVGQ
jgi:hypothetical protein